VTDARFREPASPLVRFWIQLDQPELGDALKFLRDESHLSRSDLIQLMWNVSEGGDLGVDVSLVYRWEVGEKGKPRVRPGPRYRALLGQVCEREVMTLPPIPRRDFLRKLTALFGPPLLLPAVPDLDALLGVLPWKALPQGAALVAPDDVHPVEHLRQLRALLVESDNLFGPAAVIPAVEAHIQTIQHLREGRGGADDRALLQMRAQFAEFAGWLHQDAGQWQTAQYWLDRALEWSHAVTDVPMTTYILARKSQLAGDMGDSASAVDLAGAAAIMAPPHSRLRAVAPTYAAHGYALAGEAADSLRALDDARAVVEHLDEAPPSQWAPWLDHAYIDVQRGRCLAILGDHGQAVGVFQQAIRDLPAAYRRDRGVYLGREALAHAGNREPEQAAVVGMRALAIAQQTQSGRIVKELASLDRQLARWARVRAVAELREALAAVIPPGGLPR
jgi:tetratricopeptide (TPR) repeat protein